MGNLSGKKVAVLVDKGFEEIELTSPVEALREAGADVMIVSPQSGTVKAWNHTDWGEEIDVDVELDNARPEDFDALLLPGGVMNPDKLRTNPDAVEFVRSFYVNDKPIAAICHGPWTLIEAGIVDGKQMTSYPSIRTDLTNAGATWVDEEVVVDHGLVTSRSPKDLDAFNEKMVEEFAEGRHPRNDGVENLARSTRTSA
ncbi:MAG: glutamine amidotransferase [Chlorobi bacterium]|nr:glutamine amidotransferase [Chlorobiota bacterium]